MLNRSLYLMASKLVGYGFRLLLPYFLVRLLTKADFGAYRQFFLLEVYIATLFQVGLNQALFYFIPRDPRNAGAYFLNSLALNIVVFVAAFAVVGGFAGPLGDWLNMPILGQAFWPLASYTTFLMMTTACDCYLTARQRIKASAVFEIGGQVLASVGTIWAAWTTRELLPVLEALVVTRALQMIAMFAFIHWRLRGFGAERYFHGLAEQVRYGFVLGLGGALGTMLMRLHDFVISRYYGTEAYAIYSAGCTEIPVIQMLSQSVAIVALGQFAALERDADWSGIRDLWGRVITSTWAIALPALLAMWLLAGPIVRFMFTDAYAEAVPIFRANTIVKVSLLFNATLVLRAMNRNDVTIWVNAATLGAAPFVLYAGMRAWGMPGVIGAQAGLMIASRLVPLVTLNRLTGRPLAYAPSLREMARFYVAASGEAVKRVRRALGAGGS